VAQIIMDLAIAIDCAAFKPALLNLASYGLEFSASGRHGIGKPGIKPTEQFYESLSSRIV